jgi:hypothetical protein
MMMLFKIIGFCIAVLSSVWFGLYFSEKMKRRIQELSDILSILLIIQSEICYKLSQKDAIFEKIALAISSPAVRIFSRKPDFAGLALTEQDKKVIEEFLQSFGRLDYQSQMDRIALCYQTIEHHLAGAKEEYARYAGLVRGLSPLLVSALCLLLF